MATRTHCHHSTDSRLNPPAETFSLSASAETFTLTGGRSGTADARGKSGDVPAVEPPLQGQFPHAMLSPLSHEEKNENRAPDQ